MSYHSRGVLDGSVKKDWVMKFEASEFVAISILSSLFAESAGVNKRETSDSSLAINTGMLMPLGPDTRTELKR